MTDKFAYLLFCHFFCSNPSNLNSVIFLESSGFVTILYNANILNILFNESFLELSLSKLMLKCICSPQELFVCTPKSRA